MSKSTCGSHQEALSLVRRTPATRAAWVYARQTGRLSILWRSYKRCWAELRGSTLLLYAVQESATSIQRNGPNLHHDLSSAPLGSSDVVLIQLRGARVRPEPRKHKLRIKRSSDSDVEVKLKDGVETKKWSTHLMKAIELRKIGLSDFTIVRQVGKGASGRVYLVQDKMTEEHLALKVIEKASVYENGDAYRHALDERLVLEMACEHPFILDLRYAFQTKNRLYLVTEYCEGGDLFEFLKKRGRPFREPKARLLAAEILLALEYIHKLGVVYRDLKLENVLLDLKGHIRIADFGLSKLLSKRRYASRQTASSTKRQTSEHDTEDNRTMTRTFCGTREYVAPEMLNGSEYGQSVDLWAFGILLYEILCGRTPFYSKHRDEVYDRIENAQLKFPRHLSTDVKSLIRGLLDRNPETRLGLGEDGISTIKEHPFFAGTNWNKVFNKEPNEDRINVKQRIPDVSDYSTNVGQVFNGKDADVLLEKSVEEKERNGGKRNILSNRVFWRNTTNNVSGYTFIQKSDANK